MMMDDMVKMVSEKTGLSMDQSMMAAQTMMDYMMEKMPASMTQQMKDMMMSEGMMGDIGKSMDETGGMKGKM